MNESQEITAIAYGIVGFFATLALGSWLIIASANYLHKKMFEKPQNTFRKKKLFRRF